MDHQHSFRAPNSELASGNVAADECVWSHCRGCGGKVGTPPDWIERTVECPQCGHTVPVNGKVLYRPPAEPATATAGGAEAAPTVTLPSFELSRLAGTALNWGIASVVLGWTIFVPIFGLFCYCEVSHLAYKERVPVPGKAVFGLTLSLLFGVIQGIAVFSRMR